MASVLSIFFISIPLPPLRSNSHDISIRNNLSFFFHLSHFPQEHKTLISAFLVTNVMKSLTSQLENRGWGYLEIIYFTMYTSYISHMFLSSVMFHVNHLHYNFLLNSSFMSGNAPNVTILTNANIMGLYRIKLFRDHWLI